MSRILPLFRWQLRPCANRAHFSTTSALRRNDLIHPTPNRRDAPSKSESPQQPTHYQAQQQESNTPSDSSLQHTSYLINEHDKLHKVIYPPPKYHVSRSANNNLPVYTDFKRGGNLQLTYIRNITGEVSALRDELKVFLKRPSDVSINEVTRHVVVKGLCVPEIRNFLYERGM